MSQHDFIIDNQFFPQTRADINAAFQAIASNSSGDTEPSTTYANQWWYDSTNNKLMLRNDANNAWIEIATIDETSGNVLSITTQGLTIGATALTATGTEINQLAAITRGSILYGNASGATARLAAGGASTVLTSDGTDISWAAAGGGASITVGDVGTYAMLGEPLADRPARSAGDDVAASSTLYYASANANNQGSSFGGSPSGTWRLMGAYDSSIFINDKPVSTWLRIS